MCNLCLDRRATVLVYAPIANLLSLARFVQLDVCDDCEADATRRLEADSSVAGVAQIVRWAA